jgi:hypothetical protein
MNPRAYTDDQVEFIRAKAQDHTDPQIAELLGWAPWKVLHVRKRHDIPPMPRGKFWTAPRREELRRLYEVKGLTGDAIAECMGCHGSTVRKAVLKFGFVRNPAVAARERSENARLAGLKGSASLWAGHEPKKRARPPAPVGPAAPAATVQRRHFGNGAYSPKTPVDREPLDTRILTALSERPMSAATLATLTGDKEAYVSLQLVALAHAGRVLAGEGGVRDRKWSLAA